MSYNPGKNRARTFKAASCFALVQFSNHSRDFLLSLHSVQLLLLICHRNVPKRCDKVLLYPNSKLVGAYKVSSVISKDVWSVKVDSDWPTKNLGTVISLMTKITISSIVIR